MDIIINNIINLIVISVISIMWFGVGAYYGWKAKTRKDIADYKKMCNIQKNINKKVFMENYLKGYEN